MPKSKFGKFRNKKKEFPLPERCNSSSSGVSSNSRAYRNLHSRTRRLNDISYNDGSYLALEKNMKLRSRKNTVDKSSSCNLKQSRETVALKIYNEYQYCSAEDSAIHHEMYFETEARFDSVFRTEVQVSNLWISKCLTITYTLNYILLF